MLLFDVAGLWALHVCDGLAGDGMPITSRYLYRVVFVAWRGQRLHGACGMAWCKCCRRRCCNNRQSWHRFMYRGHDAARLAEPSLPRPHSPHAAAVSAGQHRRMAFSLSPSLDLGPPPTTVHPARPLPCRAVRMGFMCALSPGWGPKLSPNPAGTVCRCAHTAKSSKCKTGCQDSCQDLHRGCTL